MSDTPTSTALVTGASRGIGRAIALRLARDGHDIIGVARNANELDSLRADVAATGRAYRAIELDLRDATATRAHLEGLHVDVLVHNAGLGVLKPFTELRPDDWAKMIDVNVNALYHATQPILPGMLARGRGHIVIIGSIAGRGAFAGGSCYAATKAFVTSFAESLMLEVRDRGVKVSVVMPGSVDTEFSGWKPGSSSWKLHADDVAESVAHVVATPPSVLVHRLEVRTLTPPQRG